MWERAVVAVLRGLIQAYSYFVSPLTAPSCRFHPSCSAYAAQALEIHGLWRGSYLAARRLGRCHPWGGSGWDPVPPSPSPKHSSAAPPRVN